MSFHPDDPHNRRDDWDRWEERERRDPWEEPARLSSAGPSVLGPAIMLLVLALFNLLGGLGSLGVAEYFNEIDIEEFRSTMAEDDPNGLDWAHDRGMSDEESQRLIVKVYCALGAGCLLAALILAAGGIAMIARKFYVLAMLAAITAFVSPGGCCLLGLVGGIWSVIVLINPDVKRSFT
jgi:hypothetical protein